MKVVDSPRGVARLVGEVPAAPLAVYRHFTDPELLVQWWPEQATVDERADGLYEFAWPGQDVRLLGQYIVTEPGSRLVFTWSFTHEPLAPSTVDVQFEAADEGTRLTIEHTHGDDPDERQGYVDGWKHFVERLRAILTEA
ncbi:MAG: SRPBCC family protein [Acidimicrobiia bacterium]